MSDETEQGKGNGRGAITRLWQALCAMRRNRRTRLHLRDLDNAALEDIGVTRDMADAEIRRSRLLF